MPIARKEVHEFLQRHVPASEPCLEVNDEINKILKRLPILRGTFVLLLPELEALELSLACTIPSAIASILRKIAKISSGAIHPVVICTGIGGFSSGR